MTASKNAAAESEPLKEDLKEDENVGLAKSLTLFNGVSIIIGCIIGSGIFVSPTGVQEKAGSVGLSLIVWTLSGAYCAIGAYCYAELGTLIKKSGGDYAYIMEAFGPFLAFIRLWVEAIVVRPCTCTIVALTFAIYMLRPFYPNCDAPDGSYVLFASTLLIILTAINCLSVRLATIVQDFFTVAKVFALLLIIATGAVLLCTGRPEYRESFENIFENTTPDIGTASLAFYSGLFAYQGWNYLNFIVEELQNPRRNLPLSIAISCTACTLIYVLVNVALYTAISPDEMLTSPAVAVEFANKMFGPFAFVMPIFVACSTIGSANGVIFTSSRLFYVGAREGHMPLVLTMINKRTRTPIPAVIFTGFLSLAYLSLSGNVFTLINYIQIVYWLAIGCAIAALFWLRRTMPTAERPIKVNLIFPIVFFVGCVALVIIPIIGSPKDTAIGMAIMLSAVPIYIIFIAWKGKPRCFDTLSDAMTRFTQKLFMVVDDSKDQ
ncbi:Large neutral amino acids transporter small subunit 1 [Toxocara canis]|uniref:Large neutral amino acids transporter small subunit 1 n=1 Tax=Toxocara canis TaxID=6265 RepID=A0A0B2UTL1_TOXCA|nr:Large neutral amino acids transporter small subunit 1 [Toxocara canis]